MVKEATTKKRAGKNIPVRIFEGGKEEVVSAPEYLQSSVSAQTLAQAAYVTSRRMRVRRAHTKERAEVRGGGAKPWRQKGTGRSRHSSRRSPLWVGGGTTFGPRSRKETISTVPRKQRVRALCGALSRHVSEDTMAIVRLGDTKDVKTKNVAPFVSGVSGLLCVVDNTSHAGFARALRNIPTVRVVDSTQVTVQDVVQADAVWIDEAALDVIESRCKV